ncbi:hypothetical protein evm_012260 [Chilo suppressalis]|nr:hypothetical protein evm_012260 [Chilo suppressalis]
MDQVYEERQEATMTNPLTFVLQFVATNGWYIVGAAAALLYLGNKLRPRYEQWKQAREDAEYHKNPDVALARMEAIQRAREKQQQLLLEASQQALQQQKEASGSQLGFSTYHFKEDLKLAYHDVMESDFRRISEVIFQLDDTVYNNTGRKKQPLLSFLPVLLSTRSPAIVLRTDGVAS